jgi:hypothetical protein
MSSLNGHEEMVPDYKPCNDPRYDPGIGPRAVGGPAPGLGTSQSPRQKIPRHHINDPLQSRDDPLPRRIPAPIRVRPKRNRGRPPAHRRRLVEYLPAPSVSMRFSYQYKQFERVAKYERAYVKSTWSSRWVLEGPGYHFVRSNNTQWMLFPVYV